MSDEFTMQQLDKEIEWYDRHAVRNQWLYRSLKLIVLVAAALIPFLSGIVGIEPLYVGGLGVLIAVAEGIQQVNQHHTNWIRFRSTCEALKQEKYLYLAKAGPYAQAKDAHALLAERVVALVSQETAKWTSVQESVDKKPTDPGGRNKHG
jgi:hypothetical protein